MKPTKELLKKGDVIVFGGIRYEYFSVKGHNIIIWSLVSDKVEAWNEHHLKEVTLWMRNALDMLKAVKCPECIDGCIEANSNINNCNKCKGTGYIIPVATRKVPRFEICTGKYGQYFIDNNNKRDDIAMTMHDVLTVLNVWALIKENE